jgi:saccharopine dehydrogenase (NAD+, L-lysine-forming)
MNICILEEKRKDERRAPIVPKDIIKLKKKYPKWKFYIEPSVRRIFSDKEYYASGCKKYNSQKIDLFLSVKEISIQKVKKNQNYLMFSHTIKGQKQNLPLLKKILKNDCSLIDYELFKTKENRREIGFGWHAGIIGCYLTLSKILKIKNKLHQRSTMNDLISQIKKSQFNNLKILITGDGQVSQGVQFFLNKIGISKSFYKVLPPNKLYKRLDKKYNLSELLKGEGVYESIFNTYIGKYDILLSCHFWDKKFPKLFNIKDINGNFFKIIGDISCDINGSIPTTIKSTKLNSPYYINRNTTIMAVDNLPSALPYETSKYFSNSLIKILPKIVQSLSQDSIEEYFISKKGYLNYRYLNLLNHLINS